MKISKSTRNKIIAVALWIAIPTCLFGWNGFQVALAPLQVGSVIWLVGFVLGNSNIKLGSSNRVNMSSAQYQIYRRAWKNRP